MMASRIFELKKMTSFPFEQREKNVFFKTNTFKTRIIELPAGGTMPDCEMKSYVIFYVIEGCAEVHVNQETGTLNAGQCLITGPVKLSIKTEFGVRMLGVQIKQ